MKKSIACAIAVTMAAGATFSSLGSSTAGPLPVNPAIKAAATTDVLDVHYRGWGGWGGGVAAGLAFGLIGAAIASQYYYPSYYDYPQPYYYAPRYYYPYAYGPSYYRAYGYYGAPVIYHRHRVIRHYHRHR